MNNKYSIAWEVVTGCTKYSPCCLNCFGEADAAASLEMGNYRYTNGFKVTLHEKDITRFAHFNHQPCHVLVAPTSDLFHKDIPDDYILEVFKAIGRRRKTSKKIRNSHIRIITKRSERMMEFTREYAIKALRGNKVSLVVTIDTPDYYYRIDHLRKTEGGSKTIIISPLLCRFPNLPLEGVHAVSVCAGELGDESRPYDIEWAYEIMEQCRRARVRFGFTQIKTILTPEDSFRQSLIFQLIEPTNGILTIPGVGHPKAWEFIALKKQLADLPIDELQAKVRQVAPEFLDPAL
jgi:protein gp37